MHAQEGYGSCLLYLSVCLSVITLLHSFSFSVLNLWIFEQKNLPFEYGYAVKKYANEHLKLLSLCSV